MKLPYLPLRWSLAAMAMVASIRLVAQSVSQPPDVLVYQGVAMDGSGEPLGASSPTNIAAVIRLFDAYTDGNLLWSEQQTLTVDSGRFAVLLGQGAAQVGEPRPALSSLFSSDTASDRYVELSLRGLGVGGTDLIVTPRTRLLTSPMAFLARHARTADRLVNGAGASVLTATATRVGVQSAQPQEALDVGGSFKAAAGRVREDMTVSGTFTAGNIDAPGAAAVGTIIMWSSLVPPAGWALCDGKVVNGVSTPDLRGRFILGSGPGVGLTSRVSGETGGAEAVALKASNLPSHRHQFTPPSVTTSAGGEHAHSYLSGLNSANPFARFGSWTMASRFGTNDTSMDGLHRHRVEFPGVASTASGEGRPHPTMPPFHVLAFIIRVQ